MAYVLVTIGYLALIGYLVYQAVMLDKLQKWNTELREEVLRNSPPF